jgi:hypothetical protein
MHESGARGLFILLGVYDRFPSGKGLGRQLTYNPVLRALLRPLILRRPLDVVDDEEAYGSVGGFEFQA